MEESQYVVQKTLFFGFMDATKLSQPPGFRESLALYYTLETK
jgi:hypothetical protein